MWRETRGGGQPVPSFLWSTRFGMSSAAAPTARCVITANMWMSSIWLRSSMWPLMALLDLLVAVLWKQELSVLRFDSFMMTCKQKIRRSSHCCSASWEECQAWLHVFSFCMVMVGNEILLYFFFLKSYQIAVSWTFHAKTWVEFVSMMFSFLFSQKYPVIKCYMIVTWIILLYEVLNRATADLFKVSNLMFLK